MTRDSALLHLSPRRLSAAAVALAAAACTFALGLADEQDRHALSARLVELGASPAIQRQIDARLAREHDPGERRVAAASALTRSDFGASGSESIEVTLARLSQAHEFATEALKLLPASWEAAGIVGAATFDLRLTRRDTRLFTAARDWEAPLTAAVARSHDAPSVEQSLARAYLEVWPALSEQKRPLAERLLRRSFTDPGFRDRNFARWLAIAGSPSAARQLLPDDPKSWQLLAGASWQAGDAPAAVGFQSRYRTSLRTSLEVRLSAALAPSDQGARSIDIELTAIIAASPTGLDFAPLVDRAAIARPPGPARPELSEAAARWIAWAWPLCLISECPLSAASLERLGAAAGSRLEGPEAAILALLANDEARAGQLARRSDALWSREWSSYLLLDARQRLDKSDRASAQQVLAQVHRGDRARPIFKALTARAGAAPDSPPEIWQPTDWRQQAGLLELECAAGRSGSAVRLQLYKPPASSGILLAEWDGRTLEPVLVPAGEPQILLSIEFAPGVHLLRLRPLVGALPELGVTTLD